MTSPLSVQHATPWASPREGGGLPAEESIPEAFPDLLCAPRERAPCIYDLKQNELQVDKFLSSEAVWCLTGTDVLRSLITGGLRFESKGLWG